MSFAQPVEQRRRASVPLAPMLDIMFLLLIFFVTTSSFRAEEQQIDVKLPTAQASSPTQPRRTEVIVNVKSDGTIVVGNQSYNPPALFEMMRSLTTDYPDEHVIIRGDKDTRYETIVSVMDVARSAGVKSIYFATVKEGRQVGK
ncbi:MAG: hypothetical protein GC162_05105 [Planctomycetes bacterium]|nr:hypothetical protein [Planctomycetota bacterium]